VAEVTTPHGLDDHTIAIWLRPDELFDLDRVLTAQGFRFRDMSDAGSLSREDGMRWSTLTCVRDQLAAIMDEADER
jgi:hypothetical protein